MLDVHERMFEVGVLCKSHPQSGCFDIALGCSLDLFVYEVVKVLWMEIGRRAARNCLGSYPSPQDGMREQMNLCGEKSFVCCGCSPIVYLSPRGDTSCLKYH